MTIKEVVADVTCDNCKKSLINLPEEKLEEIIVIEGREREYHFCNNECKIKAHDSTIKRHRM